MTEHTDSVQTPAPEADPKAEAHAEHVATGEGMPHPQPEPEPQRPAPTEPPKVEPTPAPAPSPAPTGSGTLSALKPAVSVGRIVLVREKGHPDSPCIVTSVANGLVSGNIFRGTHVPHVAENLAEIDPGNETGQGWFWAPRV